MEKVRVSHPGGPLKGRIHIGGSKSISNRVLILNALASSAGEENSGYHISNISTSADTRTLVSLLSDFKRGATTYDAHHAGTTFRFMTAFLSIQTGEQVLTGSDRMKERPIGPLVTALQQIGADIEYIEKDGYPPLKIGKFKHQKAAKLSIRSDVSSQFISALCMIAPTLEKGLRIELEGEMVSRPYLEMTLTLMRDFGVSAELADGTIIIAPQSYTQCNYEVESDWSSASYFFALAAVARGSEFELTSYHGNKLQGDSFIRQLASFFGVESRLQDKDLTIKSGGREGESLGKDVAFDFLKQPDLAQTIAVMAALQNKTIYYKGLQTLKIKETDRVAALANELAKVNVQLEELDTEFGDWKYRQSGQLRIESPIIETYQDHRMALAFASLGYLSPIEIKNPKVVEKSYPEYWKDLATLGFQLEWT